ncbi:MAG: DUF58 domain-containing protein [Lentisphaeria bacterium]|nr:DUF58 domain-containing protein [Lentisphaeria bacterium]
MKQSQFHYLPPKVLDSLKNIELVARQLVEGSITGLHRSPYHGFSAEFSEHRKYCPGDTVKHVDWLAYGKTDRYYVKQFEEETNTRCYLVLDRSKSMTLGDENQQKFNYACYLTAAFAYLMNRQKDAVGLFTYNHEIQDYLPAKSSQFHLRNLLKHLEFIQPNGKSNAAPCFHRMAAEVQRRSLVIIFSDFFDQNDDFIKSLEHFHYKQCEVILFQVLDRHEYQFPYKGLIEFKDLETGQQMELEAEDLRELYMKSLDAYNQKLKSACHRMQFTFESLHTESPFEQALAAYFHKRERLY